MARRRGLLTADTWETIFGVAYLVFGTNAMIVVASAPLLVLLITTDPVTSWPGLAVTGVLAAPALAGAFGTFRAFTVDKDTAVIRRFWRAWREQLRTAVVCGAIGVGAVGIAAVDIVAAGRIPAGAVIVPIVITFAVVAVITAVHGLVAGVERPDARLRDLLKVGLYLGVRRWYLSAVSLVILGLAAGLFVASPALAVGAAASPLLYAVWGNCRYALRPVLEPDLQPR